VGGRPRLRSPRPSRPRRDPGGFRPHTPGVARSEGFLNHARTCYLGKGTAFWASCCQPGHARRSGRHRPLANAIDGHMHMGWTGKLDSDGLPASIILIDVERHYLTSIHLANAIHIDRHQGLPFDPAGWQRSNLNSIGRSDVSHGKVSWQTRPTVVRFSSKPDSRGVLSRVIAGSC